MVQSRRKVSSGAQVVTWTNKYIAEKNTQYLGLFIYDMIKNTLFAKQKLPAQMASNAESVSIWWRYNEWQPAWNMIYFYQLIHQISLVDSLFPKTFPLNPNVI